MQISENDKYTTDEIIIKNINTNIWSTLNFAINENYWIYAECEDCHNKWKENRRKAMEAYENNMK